MTDEFLGRGVVPLPPMPTSAPIAPSPEQAIEVRASMELARVTTDSRLLRIIQTATTLKVLEQFKVIETQEQYDQAIDAFEALKAAIKDLKNMKETSYAFHKRVYDLIRDFFNPIIKGIEQTKDHVGALIQRKKDADAEAAQRAQEAAVAQAQATGEAAVVDGVVQFDDTVPVPGNVVESAKGAKVHTRTHDTLEITDLVAFLKACISKSPRYAYLAGNINEIVAVNTGLVLKIAKEKKVKKVPGCEIVAVSKVV